MKYKGIIFDLDGVICTTDAFHKKAWGAIAKKVGTKFTDETNSLIRGVSRMDSLNAILNASKVIIPESEKEELCFEKNELYKSYLASLTENDLEDGVNEILTFSKNNGIKCAIGSSSKNTKLILSKIGLGDAFDVVVDGNDIKNSKPDPEVFLLAAKRLGFDVKDCIVIEDAMSGIESAIRGGFDCAGIKDGKEHEKVTYKINNLRELIEIVK